jgi:hypothetical protein
MKTARLLLVSVFAAVSLAGCGGYPMTVEARTPPSAAQQQEKAVQQVIQQRRQNARAHSGTM